jgi:starch synthase
MASIRTDGIPRLIRTCRPASTQALALRAENKTALQKRMGLAIDPVAPLFGVVGRLTWQKGMDLLQGTLPRLIQLGAQFVLVGSGDGALEAAFTAASRQNPRRSRRVRRL